PTTPPRSSGASKKRAFSRRSGASGACSRSVPPVA
ncbi:MAG: hypothetical protein AVDCRST_MAG59-2376, partial [uncultured Thermomicrobiales bacterium]